MQLTSFNKFILPKLILSLITAPVFAAELVITVAIPQLEVAEYHRPYTAFWLEQDGTHVANLAVWYDVEMKEERGEEWLKDMRQWWRRSGRSIEMPVDGVSGATRAPGTHSVTFTPGQGALAEFPAGEYQLLVEAAREVGGREVLKVPFQWPPQSATTLTANGGTELGVLTLQLNP